MDVEETPVGQKADLPEGGKIVEPSADTEVTGVVDGGFGPEGLALLVILLDPGVLVVDVEGGGDPLGYDPGAELTLFSKIKET